MALKAVLVFSNDDGFSLGVELLRASVEERLTPAQVDHRVWFHEALGSLTDDYLGHYNRFLARVFALRPDVVAFSVFVWNHDEFVRMSRLIRRHLPECTILWGGSDVNSRRRADWLLTHYPWVDLILRGEAEISYPALLATLAEGGDLSAVAGLSRRVDGQVVHHDDAPDVDMSALPLVFTPQRLPLDPIFRRAPQATLAYETGRGCRQKCRFCLYAVSKLRGFPMDRIATELAYLLDAGIPYLRICDAHLGISRPRAMEIFEIIGAHNRRTQVDVYPDVKHVDLEYVRAMDRSGCRVVSLGIQSSDPDTLLLSARRFDPVRFAEVAKLIRRHHNHQLSADVIIGMPGDNYLKVKESIRFAYRSGVEKVHFAPLMAFPGTNFYEDAERYGLESFDFAPPLVVQSTGFDDEEYRRAMILAHRIDVLQETAPTLLRCLIALEADPVDLAETVDLAEMVDLDLASGDPLDVPGLRHWIASRPDPGPGLLGQALAWDRALRRQQQDPVVAVPPLTDDAEIAAVRPDAVVWCDVPIHALVRDHELSYPQLPVGRFGYLFPPGGLAGYELTEPLRAALDAALPGLTVDEWRARTAAAAAAGPTAVATPPDPAVTPDAAFRLLCLAGVVEVTGPPASRNGGPGSDRELARAAAGGGPE